MRGIKGLTFLALVFSILGAVTVCLAVAQKFGGGDAAGWAAPSYALLSFVGVLMGALGAVASLASTALRAQAAQIEKLERRLSESDGQLEAVRESLRARVGALERQQDESRAVSPAAPKP